MLWSMDMYSECNTGHGNSGANDTPAIGQHGMQDCAFEIDDGAFEPLPLSFFMPSTLGTNSNLVVE